MHTIQTFVVLAAVCALGSPAEEARTATEFLRSGPPSIVLGTQGDERADRGIAVQVDVIRAMVFPESALVDDDSIDVQKGPSAWPSTPMLYGGAHLNSVLAGLGACLPLQVSAGSIEIAGETYTGDEYRLIALVPALRATDDCPGSPQFMLYAGAGTPGVTEINATPDGNYGFVVADRFGVLDAGFFERDEHGAPVAKITHHALRKPWRAKRVTTDEYPEPKLIAKRLQILPAAAEEGAQDLALLRGVQRARSMLKLAEAAPIEIYVYPDAKTKASITRAGDGHADPASRTLHMTVFDASIDGPLERLCAHEAVHILATDAFGSPGSPLWGEGLAVWVADQYGGRSLREWRLDPPRSDQEIRELAGAGFARTPERVSYPLAGLLVSDLIHEHGLEAFIEHIYPAGPDRLEAACAALDLSTADLDAMLRRHREK